MATPCSFAPDPWLADTLERPVFTWTAAANGSSDVLAAEMAALAGDGDAFFFAKIATTAVELGTLLTRAGFSVVDTNITFAWEGGKDARPTDVVVGPARPDQHEAIADVAERCFRWSRFHLDTRIPVPLANRVKRRWIENYCRKKRGAALYVGEVGGTVAGFLAVMESHVDNRPVATIDLIGVGQEHQGRGVGGALVRHFVNEWRGRVSELRVGTQAANIPSMRFYERLGFRIAESSYVLHAHYRNGALW